MSPFYSFPSFPSPPKSQLTNTPLGKLVCTDEEPSRTKSNISRMFELSKTKMHGDNDFHPYPCTNSRSWGCNSSSLRVSILLEIASTECIETVIWVSRSLMAAFVLSVLEGSTPFTSWFLSCLYFFSYAIRTRSPAC